MMMLECGENTDIVRYHSCDHRTVEYLMRGADDVEFSWVPFLRYTTRTVMQEVYQSESVHGAGRELTM